jgi:hypothetical protein
MQTALFSADALNKLGYIFPKSRLIKMLTSRVGNSPIRNQNPLMPVVPRSNNDIIAIAQIMIKGAKTMNI